MEDSTIIFGNRNAYAQSENFCDLLKIKIADSIRFIIDALKTFKQKFDLLNFDFLFACHLQ